MVRDSRKTNGSKGQHLDVERSLHDVNDCISYHRLDLDMDNILAKTADDHGWELDMLTKTAKATFYILVVGRESKIKMGEDIIGAYRGIEAGTCGNPKGRRPHTTGKLNCSYVERTGAVTVGYFYVCSMIY